METTGEAAIVPAEARALINELAAAEGFTLVRVAGAEMLDTARDAALARQREGLFAEMGWMTTEWAERATDPGEFLEGARSLILLALPYAPPDAHHDEEPGAPPRGRIACYAQGRDYHRVFEKKLRRIARSIREEFGAETRVTVDYGPLLERPFAARAGMGWLGKSTMLLVPGLGPWVLLGVVATTLEMEPDQPLKKTCGSCTRCIVACPTGAISPEGNVLDARLCISYHTIENRGAIPRELRPKFGDWIFGCDDCLSSCPVGIRHQEGYPDFDPPAEEDARPRLAPLLSLSESEFAERYRGRAIMRAKRDGFLRNVCVALGNVGGVNDVPALVDALDDASPLVRGHAAWAIGRIARRCAVEAPMLALAARLSGEDDDFVREELALALAEAGS
jgi:epoxyqueuosine reductase